MARFDLYDITFEWSDESETSFSCSASNPQDVLAEAMNDDDVMSPTDANAELLTITIQNKSAVDRQDSYEAEQIYSR
jgi:hypothetical protein